MAILILWLIAKGLNLFNTPFYIEMIPYFGGFLAVLGMAKEIVRSP